MQEVLESGMVMADEVARVEAGSVGEPVADSIDKPLFAVERIDPVARLESDIDPQDLPQELDAANLAYRSVLNGCGDQKATFRNRLIAYLEENYSDLPKEAVQRIATVANPDKTTGRKKSNIE